MNDKLDYIKQLSFFNSLPDEKVNIIDDMSKIITYPKNSILYYENDIHNKIFFLVSGLLKVYKIDKFDFKISFNHEKVKNNDIVFIFIYYTYFFI